MLQTKVNDKDLLTGPSVSFLLALDLIYLCFCIIVSHLLGYLITASHYKMRTDSNGSQLDEIPISEVDLRVCSATLTNP